MITGKIKTYGIMALVAIAIVGTGCKKKKKVGPLGPPLLPRR